MGNPKDKLGNEILKGDICVMENGGTIGILLYSHRAKSTYVFLNTVDGKSPENNGSSLYSGNVRYIQHNQVGEKVINLTKMKELNLINTITND